MTCLCFSDSHGVTRYIKEALDRHRDADAVFFLGDGLSDIEPFVNADIGKRAWFFVRGNCDFYGSVNGIEARKLETLTLEGQRIAFTHGDLYGVKYGFDGVVRLAENSSADIVLFGHTHFATEKYVPLLLSDRGVNLFNPGTVGGIGAEPTYGVLTLSPKGALFSVMNFK